MAPIRNQSKSRSKDRSGDQNGPLPLIRRVETSDLESIVALDQHVTGLAKRSYWREILERAAARRHVPVLLSRVEIDFGQLRFCAVRGRSSTCSLTTALRLSAIA